ncbi:hypothetical protein Tco_0003535 [Tanacetum coccineum]
MGTFRETLAEGTKGAPHLGLERPRVYSDLSPEDKERYNADIRATNILLQGLPKDIYSLINHYIDAKDIWDIVKMLLEGSKLTKEDRESQLYDDFEHFCQNKGETIHDYYVRFAKLINDMRNIKMTMSRMQLNSKFMNNMLLEWGRFVIAVKLNKGLRDSNMISSKFQDGRLWVKMLRSKNEVQGNNAITQKLKIKKGWSVVGYGGSGPELGMYSSVIRQRPLMKMRMSNVQDLNTYVDNVFQADGRCAFDTELYELPQNKTMFIALDNLSS